jgi:hypothetical protein
MDCEEPPCFIECRRRMRRAEIGMRGHSESVLRTRELLHFTDPSQSSEPSPQLSHSFYGGRLVVRAVQQQRGRDHRVREIKRLKSTSIIQLATRKAVENHDRAHRAVHSGTHKRVDAALAESGER